MEKNPRLSINDAAALLVQIEPDDISELNNLLEVLKNITEPALNQEAFREKIAHAAEKIEKVISKDVPDPYAAITEVGRLIEEAMNISEDDIKHDRNVKREDLSPAPPSPQKGGMRGGGGEAIEGEPKNWGMDFLLSQDADPDLVSAFIAESIDLITNAEDALLELENDPEDIEAVSTVFRAFHTIKGTSAFLELTFVSEMAHKAESILSRIREREIRYAGGYPDLALRSIDMLKDLIRCVQEALDGKPFLKPKAYDTLMQILANPEAAGITDEKGEDRNVKEEVAPLLPSTTPPSPPKGRNEGGLGVKEAVALLLPSTTPPSPPKGGNEGGLGVKEAVAPLLPPKGGNEGGVKEEARRVKKEDVSPFKVQISRRQPSPSRKVQRHEEDDDDNDIKNFVDDLLGPSHEGNGKRKQIVESTVRVPVDRLDRLIDMVGELVVAHSMVAQNEVIVSGRHHDLSKKVTHTNKIVRELQHMSMSMRMIPLKGTFRKMARLVRDLSHKVGKNIAFVTEGEDTEIDRNMVDIINDPLMHMVRNAVDHGIEAPEDRINKGKTRNGTVSLSAYHTAGNVVVELKDDGKGLDQDAIIRKAKEKGLISDETSLTERQIYNLIFEPGFSTAAQVSEVSGRGVGMDVVKKNVESLRGQIDIQSTPGNGSRFIMRLPLTLAIIDGMVIRLGKERYVLPTISIVRSIQPSKGDISTVLRRGEMISLQGKLIPIFRLNQLFDIKDTEDDPTKAIVVIVEDEGAQAGLLIDELIGSQQIVIKTLGEAMGSIPGISGSAIMPDGRVGLILDVGGLVRLAQKI